MIHTIKNYKWVIATSLICILFGVLTFFTFINQGFIKLTDFNLQILLFSDLILLILFFGLIIYKTYKILSERKKGKLGSETSLRYILFFSTTTLLPSILIAIFSLFFALISPDSAFATLVLWFQSLLPDPFYARYTVSYIGASYMPGQNPLKTVRT